MKVLIGVAPNSIITFISAAYPGSITDKELTIASGILSLLVPGDNIMADKGFLIENLLPEGRPSFDAPSSS